MLLYVPLADGVPNSRIVAEKQVEMDRLNADITVKKEK